MPDKPWKAHERKVAKHFGTQRRTRGADFGVSDVEVLATLNDWLKNGDNDTGIVVECKYRKSHPIINLMKDYHKDDSVFVGFLGDYVLCWLEDFEKIFPIILDEEIRFDQLNSLNIHTIDKRVPDYLEEYTKQATEYTKNTTKVLLAIVCMAQAGSKWRAVAIHRDSIKDFTSRKAHIESTKLHNQLSTTKVTDK